MKHHASPRFWRCYDALPERVQVLADKNFELLKSDPAHPSLHFKHVGRLRSAPDFGTAAHIRAAKDALVGRIGFPPLLIVTSYRRDGAAVLVDLRAGLAAEAQVEKRRRDSSYSRRWVSDRLGPPYLGSHHDVVLLGNG